MAVVVVRKVEAVVLVDRAVVLGVLGLLVAKLLLVADHQEALAGALHPIQII
jgi:hypothetical protein